MISSEIRHEAVITHIEGGVLTLAFERQEACGACAAKSVCGAGESKALKLADDGAGRSVGDRVTLVVGRSMGLWAAVVAYLLPVAFALITLLALQQIGVPEMASAWATLGVLAAYFCVLYLLRKKLNNKIILKIE